MNVLLRTVVYGLFAMMVSHCGGTTISNPDEQPAFESFPSIEITNKQILDQAVALKVMGQKILAKKGAIRDRIVILGSDNGAFTYGLCASLLGAKVTINKVPLKENEQRLIFLRRDSQVLRESLFGEDISRELEAYPVKSGEAFVLKEADLSNLLLKIMAELKRLGSDISIVAGYKPSTFDGRNLVVQTPKEGFTTLVGERFVVADTSAHVLDLFRLDQSQNVQELTYGSRDVTITTIKGAQEYSDNWLTSGQKRTELVSTVGQLANLGTDNVAAAGLKHLISPKSIIQYASWSVKKHALLHVETWSKNEAYSAASSSVLAMGDVAWTQDPLMHLSGERALQTGVVAAFSQLYFKDTEADTNNLLQALHSEELNLTLGSFQAKTEGLVANAAVLKTLKQTQQQRILESLMSL